MNVAVSDNGNVKFTISQLLLPCENEVRDGNVADIQCCRVIVFNTNVEYGKSG